MRWTPCSDLKGGEKEGRYEFLFGMDAGVTFNLTSEWEVTAPTDLIWYKVTGRFN